MIHNTVLVPDVQHIVQSYIRVLQILSLFGYYRTSRRVPCAMEETLVLICFIQKCTQYQGFPGGSDGEAAAYNAGDPDSIPGSGRPSGEGNGNPLQCSCLENPMDGGAW